MSSIFSAISGQFGRAFFIGALLPATLFVLALHLVVIPMLPWQWHSVPGLDILDPQWTVAVLTGAAVIIAGLLYAFNTPIVRLYEGYPWQNGLIGTWMCTRHRQRLVDADRGRREARAARRRLEEPDDERLRAELQALQNNLAHRIADEYPVGRSVLPTRIGNTIRSFENYPRKQYGIWAITLFPRFVAKIPKEYATVIDDAKTMLDVVVHLSFLSCVFATIVLVTGCIYPIPLASWFLAARWGATILGAFSLGALLYYGSIGRAKEWGDLVRAAFDIYRWDVLKDLGYAQKPATMDEERELWNDISRQLAYGDALDGTKPRYSSELTPGLPTLELTRGVAEVASTSRRRITVRVENRGNKRVEGIVVTELLPEGWQYVWDSAAAPGTVAFRVAGSNPYRFSIGTLDAERSLLFSYEIIDKQ